MTTIYPDGAFKGLDPSFSVIQQGLTGFVDGQHFLGIIADNAIFEFLYTAPGWPQRIDGRDNLMAIFSGYGNMIALRSADELVVHKSQDPRVVILEYAVHGTVLRTGLDYNNHFISVIAIEDRKIVHWRDYTDSYGAMAALTGTGN